MYGPISVIGSERGGSYRQDLVLLQTAKQGDRRRDDQKAAVLSGLDISLSER